MFASRYLTNALNIIQDRPLRLIYNNCEFTFDRIFGESKKIYTSKNIKL